MKFKVGDRVHSEKFGDGTVVRCEGIGQYQVAVRFDKEDSYLHSAYGNCKMGYGRFYFEDGSSDGIGDSITLISTKHIYTPEQIQEAKNIVYDIAFNELWKKRDSHLSIPKPDHGIIKASIDNGKSWHTARCSPNDKWNRDIGLMVALCKATGRKLPSWLD